MFSAAGFGPVEGGGHATGAREKLCHLESWRRGAALGLCTTVVHVAVDVDRACSRTQG